MIDFHTPDIADRCWAEERLAGNSSRACEYNFTTLLVWAAGYQITVGRGDALTEWNDKEQ